MKKLLSVVLLVGAVSLNTLAITISPPASWWDSSNNNLDAAALKDLTGVVGLELQYKAEVGKSQDSGPFASSYTTKFDLPNLADITKDPGPSILGDVILLVVKDGMNWGNLIFDISFWNGVDALNIDTTFTKGDISNLAIWTTSGGNRVPDGGATAALLGLGLLGMAAIRRKS